MRGGPGEVNEEGRDWGARGSGEASKTGRDRRLGQAVGVGPREGSGSGRGRQPRWAGTGSRDGQGEAIGPGRESRSREAWRGDEAGSGCGARRVAGWESQLWRAAGGERDRPGQVVGAGRDRRSRRAGRDDRDGPGESIKTGRGKGPRRVVNVCVAGSRQGRAGGAIEASREGRSRRQGVVCEADQER